MLHKIYKWLTVQTKTGGYTRGYKIWEWAFVWACTWACVWGHGRLVDPPARSTMWRLGFDTPVHYNDHQLYCGGFSRQWVQNKGRCGECGDPWDLPRPRPHEAGGVFGTGVLSRVYTQGQVMTATVHLTANHLGWFEFRLCPTNDPKIYARQSCLNKHVLSLVDHPGTRYQIRHSHTGLFRVRLQLPSHLTCSHCVLQWHYTTGNNWGKCGGGDGGRPGCGPQEVFRGCADIAIFPPGDPHLSLYHNSTTPADLSELLHLMDEPWPDHDHHQELPNTLPDAFKSTGDESDLKSVTHHTQPTNPPGNHLVTIQDRLKTLPPSPALTFIDDDSDLPPPKQSLAPSGKKYVSSDAFRGVPQKEGRIQISASTPFLSRDTPSPFVLTPDSLGETPSPLGPPLTLPLSREPQPSATPGGLHSVHSLRPPPYRPLQELAKGGSAKAGKVDRSGVEGSEVVGLKGRLDDDRLQLLQHALTLATAASQGDSPPIVVILV